MWAYFPIIGWSIALIFDVFLAIPTYFLWNYLVPKYFTFIPDIYYNLPFWDIVWILLLVSIVKTVFLSGVFSNKTNVETKK